MTEKKLINEGRFEIIVKRYTTGTQIERNNVGISDHEIISIAEIMKAEALKRLIDTTRIGFGEASDKEMD